MIINLSRIDFGGITGGKSKPEEVFDVQPTTAEQIITPTEGSVFSGGTVRAVTSEIDVNIVSNNIKEGITILGVAGSHKGEKPEESFNVQPTTTEQTITPTAGSVFSSGTVKAVTSAIDSNILPENIKQGVSILGVAGTLSEGITPAGTIAINLNGTYDVTNYASAEVNVGDTPDYRYMKGTVDKTGLKAIGWTDDDILTYEQNTPHYAWQNDQFIVSDENKALYGVYTNETIGGIVEKSYCQFAPKVSGPIYSNRTFRNNPYIKGYPMLEFAGDYAEELFARNTSLITIPPFVIPAYDWMDMFRGCSSLIIIPLLDSSHVRLMNNMFYGCSNLNSIPQLNTSNVTNMGGMFNGCSKLNSIPQLNTSNVTNMGGMFNGCSSLTSIPQLNTSKVTDMDNMFEKCASLTTIPQLDTSKVTKMSNIFKGCSKLTSIPPLNFSNITNAESVFDDCSSLTSIPPLDTSKVTNMRYMFSGCSSLTTVEGIDFSGLTSSPNYMFGFSSNRITRFIVNGKINVSISDNYGIKMLTKIDYDSVKSILAAADRTDNTNSKTLAFNRTIIDPDGELTSLVASCSTKGWTITGLTLKPREDVILTCSDVVLTDGKVDYIPVTIDSVNNWNTTRYNSDTVESGWLELGAYDGSTELMYNYSGSHWGDLTGQTAGINTANLRVSDYTGIVSKYGDLPEGIKLIAYFGIKDSSNAWYKYDITLERINGQVTTTLHTISPYA